MAECIIFTVVVELWTEFWQLNNIFEPPMENGQLFVFLLPHTPYGHVTDCEACALCTRKTLMPRFTDFLTVFEKKTDCFAVYVKF